MTTAPTPEPQPFTLNPSRMIGRPRYMSATHSAGHRRSCSVAVIRGGFTRTGADCGLGSEHTYQPAQLGQARLFPGTAVEMGPILSSVHSPAHSRHILQHALRYTPRTYYCVAQSTIINLASPSHWPRPRPAIDSNSAGRAPARHRSHRAYIRSIRTQHPLRSR